MLAGIINNEIRVANSLSILLRFIKRSVAYGCSQSSLSLFFPNHISHKVLGFLPTKVKVSNPNQK